MLLGIAQPHLHYITARVAPLLAERDPTCIASGGRFGRFHWLLKPACRYSFRYTARVNDLETHARGI
jgi:hypothetical protein